MRRLPIDLNGPHAEMLDLFKRELLIVFLRRLGGTVSIPCNEVDATDGLGLALRIDENNVFHFELTDASAPPAARAAKENGP